MHIPLLFKKQKRNVRRIAALTITLFIFLGPVSFFLAQRGQTAAWYDDSYAYRQRFSFTHNANISGDRAVTFSLNTATLISAGIMQADCDDVRYTDVNGKSLRYQMTGTCNNAATTYEVVFPSIINGTNYAYVYYGNPSASSASQNVSGVTTLTPSGGDPSLTDRAVEEKGQAPDVYWRFDDNIGATAQDSTANNIDATLANTPTWQQENMCISGGCLKFDGSSNYATTSGNYNLSGSSLTFTAWIRVNAFQTNSPYISSIIGEEDSSSVNGALLRLGDGSGISNDQLQFVLMFAGGQVKLDGITHLNANRWYHVAATYNGSEMRLYLNGKLENSRSQSGSIIANTVLRASWSYNGRYMNGSIDEIKVYRYARSAKQILLDYNSNAAAASKGSSAVMGVRDTSILSNGLVGYWKMDENVSGNSQTLRDASGNAFDLTTNYGANASGMDCTTPGQFGTGCTFDGSDDKATVGDNSMLRPANNFTISTWVKPSSTTGNPAIIRKGGTNGFEAYVLDIVSGQWRFFIRTNNCSPCSISTGTPSTTKWTHLVGTYDGTKIVFYINGAVAGTTPASGTTIQDNVTALGIGNAPDGWNIPWSGLIDETRIYNRTLSPAEVNQLYNWAPGPIGWWKMDDGSGSTVSDSSGNGNNGTAAFSPQWTAGKYGKSLQFNGSTQNVSIGNQTVYQNLYSKAFTAEAWVYPRGRPTIDDKRTVIIGRSNNADFKWHLALWRSNSTDYQIEANIENNAISRASSTLYPLNLDTWTHIGMTYDNTGDRKVHLYVNGVEVVYNTNNAFSGTVGSDTSNNLKIGSFTNDVEYWNGNIDDVKIYNYARNQKQIVEDMNAGHPIVGTPVASPVSHYKFNEGALNTCSGGANDFCDSTPNGNDLTYSTTTGGYTQSGKFGKAYHGANNTRATRSDDDDFDFSSGSNDFTLSAWFNRGGTISNAEYLIDKHSGNDGYTLYMDSDGDIVCGIGDGAASFPEETIGGNLSKNYDDTSWHHAVCVKQGTSSLRLYVDGREIASNTSLTVTDDMSNTGKLIIGDANETDGTDEWLGDIDEVKIYRAALNAEDVKLEYNQAKSMVLGASGTDTSGNATFAAQREYCPPGNAEGNCAAGQNPAPVGEWNFEESNGTSAIDTSGTGNTGTWSGSGGPIRGPGKYGSAAITNSSVGAVTVADHSSLDFSTAMTIQAWINPTSMVESYILSKWNHDAASDSYLLGMDANGEAYIGIDNDGDIFNGGCWLATPTGLISSNLWQHLTLTYNAGTVILYINGIEKYRDTSSCPTTIYNGGTEFRIGALGDAGGYGYFNGKMDQVRAYNYARTPAQVAWDYNRGGPIGWWKFDERSGSTANDSSGNSNTGSLVNSPAWVDGKINSGTDLEYSNNNYISVANENNFDLTGSMSISAWVKAESVPTIWSPIITKGDNAWRLTISGATGTKPNFSTNGLSEVDTQSNTDIASDGQWHHITAVYNATAGKKQIYIDGKLDKETSSVTGSISTNNISVEIGRNGFETTRTFDGIIDDVRVYNYNLSAAQVKLIYNNGGAVRFAPLTGTP